MMTHANNEMTIIPEMPPITPATIDGAVGLISVCTTDGEVEVAEALASDADWDPLEVRLGVFELADDAE